MMANIDKWFKKCTSIRDRMAIEMNRYLKETDISE